MSKTASKIYASALQDALSGARANQAAQKVTLSIEQIEAEIANINEQLKGHVPNLVRLDMIESRAVLRKALEMKRAEA